MRALQPVLLLLLATLLLECSGKNEDAPNEADADDDSDSAPFMIVVEHHGGGEALWRCSGSLVSLRTGVTSVECALGRESAAGAGAGVAMSELWALAAATAAGQASRQDGARRVSRLATAGQRQGGSNGDGADWDDGLLDLAVLELDSPFGSGAHARPILMATAPHECADVGMCHVVRSLEAHGAGGGSARLRIVDATLGDEAPCAELVRHWAALRERALCLTGPELCSSERGAGVVCGGKLCGVVSRSAAGGAGGAGGEDDHQCGNTHAAQSVARWRRFLHCAHTLRACGRGSCAELCSERRLLDESEETTEAEAGVKPSRTTYPAGTPPTPARTSPAPLERDEPPQRDHERDHEREREHAPHAHSVQLDLAHIAPDTYRYEYTNSTRVVPPTRVRPEEYAQQSQTLAPPPPASAGVAPTRTTLWSSTTVAAPQTRHPVTFSPVVYAPEPLQRPSPTAPRPDPPAAPRVAPPAPASRAPAAAARVTHQQLGRPVHRPRLPTRRPPPTKPSQLPPLTELTSSSSVRPTPLFEPNRPDFRAGEYGDNAAEYGAPADDGSITTTTTIASTFPNATVGTTAASYTGVDAPRTPSLRPVTRDAAREQAQPRAPPPSEARRQQPKQQFVSRPLALSWIVPEVEVWPRVRTSTARTGGRQTASTRTPHTPARPVPHARDDVLDDDAPRLQYSAEQQPHDASRQELLYAPRVPSARPESHHTELPRLLFEPNRADFQVGEYGDNAAAYVESDDDGAPLPPASYGADTPPPPAPTVAPPLPPPTRALAAACTRHRSSIAGTNAQNKGRITSTSTTHSPEHQPHQLVQDQAKINKSAALISYFFGQFSSILILILLYYTNY